MDESLLSAPLSSCIFKTYFFSIEKVAAPSSLSALWWVNSSHLSVLWLLLSWLIPFDLFHSFTFLSRLFLSSSFFTFVELLMPVKQDVIKYTTICQTNFLRCKFFSISVYCWRILFIKIYTYLFGHGLALSYLGSRSSTMLSQNFQQETLKPPGCYPESACVARLARQRFQKRTNVFLQWPFCYIGLLLDLYRHFDSGHWFLDRMFSA